MRCLAMFTVMSACLVAVGCAGDPFHIGAMYSGDGKLHKAFGPIMYKYSITFPEIDLSQSQTVTYRFRGAPRSWYHFVFGPTDDINGGRIRLGQPPLSDVSVVLRRDGGPEVWSRSAFLPEWRGPGQLDLDHGKYVLTIEVRTRSDGSPAYVRQPKFLGGGR